MKEIIKSISFYEKERKTKEPRAFSLDGRWFFVYNHITK